jgi:hypothetical protein
LGYVAPTILVLRGLLISFTDLKYCKPLSLAIIQAIETRFNYILDLSRPESKAFIMASISHPKFKLSWIPLRYMNLCKNLFITECCLRINTETKSTNLTVRSLIRMTVMMIFSIVFAIKMILPAHLNPNQEIQIYKHYLS